MHAYRATITLGRLLRLKTFSTFFEIERPLIGPLLMENCINLNRKLLSVLNSCVQINFREQEKNQLTIFYNGKVLVFNDFPADKAKGLMQLASKGSPIVPNVSTPTPVTDSTKVQMPVLAPASSLPGAQVDAHKPAGPNASGDYSAHSF